MTNIMKFQFNGRKQPYGQGTDLSVLNESVGKNVLAFHKKFPNYSITPLRALPYLSQRLGLGSLHIKDESARFGLNAFKGRAVLMPSGNIWRNNWSGILIR